MTHKNEFSSSGSSPGTGDKILNAASAARYVGVCKKTLLRFCHSRQITFIRYPDNSFRFRQSALDYFLNSRTEKAAA